MRLRIFDTQGREVAHNSFSGLRAGIRREPWEVRDPAGHHLPCGSYWVRMEAPGGSRTVRWMILR